MKFLIACAVIYAIWWMGNRRKVPKLSLREARELLEVPASASAEDIRAAHRRLIGRVHPDVGGSAALAGRVNAARDLLVMELNRKRA